MERSRIDAFLREQEGLTEVNRASIEAMQLSKLNGLLGREKRRGGYYKDLPESLKSLRELQGLPFTTDAELSTRGGELLLLSQSEVQRVLSDATSGTTGAAKRVFYSKGDCDNTVALFAAGLGELVFPGDRVMICMPFSGPFGLGELICAAIERLGAKPLRLGVGLSYGELKRVMDVRRPDCYVGMPVALLSLLRVCGRGSLRRALVSGDTCPETVTAECEAILGSRLFPHYGSREMALGGAICCQAHEGMHLRENHVIAEIVDGHGRVMPEGDWGELVITTIGMEAQPLIRYRTGDRTRIIPEPCPCGSEVLRLDRVSRMESDGISALDEKLFFLPWLVDHRVSRSGKGLLIEAYGLEGLSERELHTLCPEATELRLRPVRGEDGPLYKGKRVILEMP